MTNKRSSCVGRLDSNRPRLIERGGVEQESRRPTEGARNNDRNKNRILKQPTGTVEVMRKQKHRLLSMHFIQLRNKFSGFLVICSDGYSSSSAIMLTSQDHPLTWAW